MVKKGQNLVHVVIERPLIMSYLRSFEKVKVGFVVAEFNPQPGTTKRLKYCTISAMTAMAHKLAINLTKKIPS